MGQQQYYHKKKLELNLLLKISGIFRNASDVPKQPPME